jgi:hypothetical protein
MTGTDVYNKALISLGYRDSQVLKNKCLVVANQVYDDLYNKTFGEHKPLTALKENINIPEKFLNAMVYGVAEKLALGEGDGELQQYFAKAYDRARARITTVDKVKDVYGGAL